jgi:hypothetical protein
MNISTLVDRKGEILTTSFFSHGVKKIGDT